jgi:NADH pyrophosphatase NudC (nudix superfamily)
LESTNRNGNQQSSARNLRNVKEIPSYSPSSSAVRKPSYVLLEYRRGLLGLYRKQIELTFNERATNTIVTVKWAYPTFENELRKSTGFSHVLNERNAREAKQNTVWAVEELKSRLGGTEITEDEPIAVKEIIKEKQVIVKVRCEYCGNLYDESLDKCSTCGGRASGKRQPEQANFCPDCGTKRDEDAQFCKKCGKKFV